ncbi:polysaccharide deacetylase family protein [Aspergillus puulaauensis]|uniref:NodB homology domain-containing protein n=1 Tax=Aspergillus puulaauensis TaxID=1220207 RepID=A0A7R7XE77_9EURO|nr:uncharacterized protein APUU_20082A [Aspergillus puulaauensis]BCS19650.1 hypothetical protein APUU_20082A [Aspergillus puulaauensis]
MVKRVLVGYGIDVDAVSGWINTCSGAPAGPTDVSRGIFGATVGIDRILKLLDKYGIKATWFVPGHSVESFPDQMNKVRDGGHEIGLHGYCHEFVATLGEQQQRDVMGKSIDVLTKFTGKKPRGWTAPAWDTSKQTVKVLEEFGIEYDHSFMHHDCQPYYVPNGEERWKETNVQNEASTWMEPMSRITPSKIVEIPANWHLDDWPPFVVSFKGHASQGYVSPDVIENLWKKQFDYFYREYDTFIFPMTIHPQVSGKPQVILMHENIIEYINSHEGVEWVTMEQMVDEFKSGKIPGAVVEGGV